MFAPLTRRCAFRFDRKMELQVPHVSANSSSSTLSQENTSVVGSRRHGLVWHERLRSRTLGAAHRGRFSAAILGPPVRGPSSLRATDVKWAESRSNYQPSSCDGFIGQRTSILGLAIGSLALSAAARIGTGPQRGPIPRHFVPLDRADVADLIAASCTRDAGRLVHIHARVSRSP